MDKVGTIVCTDIYVMRTTTSTVKELSNKNKTVQKSNKTLETNDIEHKVNAMKNMFFSALFSFISFCVNTGGLGRVT